MTAKTPIREQRTNLAIELDAGLVGAGGGN
jgi:hypothetical protein